MRLRNITGCREMIGESEFVVHEPETMKGKWREAFGNDHPVYVEIGMGKGRFLMEEVEAAGWTLKEKTFDLHADARLNEGNVMTEYEERFSAQGNPICKYIISR